MFDLEKAITNWRQQLLAAGIKTPVPLHELECHLREEIERQMRTGLNVQQAFAVAMRHLGKANLLNDEFKKEAKEARNWKLIHIIGAGYLCLLSSIFATALFQNGNLTSAQRMSGLIALAVFNLLTVSGRLGFHLFPVIANRRIRSIIHVVIGVLGGLWVSIFFKVILLHLDNTVSPLIVSGLWLVMVPIGILYSLMAGIETAAWKNPRPAAV
jgi:hypothetical protein